MRAGHGGSSQGRLKENQMANVKAANAAEINQDFMDAAAVDGSRIYTAMRRR